MYRVSAKQLAAIVILTAAVIGGIFAVAAGSNHSVAINGQGVLQGNVILQSAVCSGATLRFEFRPQGGGTLRGR